MFPFSVYCDTVSWSTPRHLQLFGGMVVPLAWCPVRPNTVPIAPTMAGILHQVTGPIMCWPDVVLHRWSTNAVLPWLLDVLVAPYVQHLRALKLSVESHVAASG
jgi:hypothetical protein